MAVTPQLVKELRDRSGVGMSKCKEALDQANGNMEEAIDILRKSGIASAVKKHGRETKEGSIFFKETNDTIALVEINAETDFVAKNEKFQEFGREIAQEIAETKPESLEVFLQSAYSKDPSITIEAKRALIIQLIGENIVIKRLTTIAKDPSKTFGIYSHMGGKIVTVIELEGAGEAELAKDIAMHIAAANPEYTYPENVPQDVVAKEKEIAKSQITNKPANIIDKILEGKISTFFDQVCLVRQKFVKDTTISIGDLVKKRAQATGKPLRVVSFVRWMLGH